jgi:hypothetical protein
VLVRALEPADVAALADVWLGAGDGERVAGDVHARTAATRSSSRRCCARSPSTPPIRTRERAPRGGCPARPPGPEAEELLGVAAVLGQDMEIWVLGRVAGLSDDAIEAALDELLAAHLLRPGAGPARSVEFPHALVREAVYGELNALKRARLAPHRRRRPHRSVRGAHVEAIAHHLSERSDRARAADYLARAARAPWRCSPTRRPRCTTSGAIEATRRGGELWLAAAKRCCGRASRWRARECFLAARGIARRGGDRRLLARAALGHSGLGVSIIEVDHAKVAVLEEALAALGDERAAAVLAAARATRAGALLRAVADRSEALSARAVAVARQAADPAAVAAALGARHVALWRPDRLDARRAAAEEMIEAARAAGDRDWSCRAATGS